MEEMRNANKILVGIFKYKHPRGKLRIIFEDYIKKVLKYETAALPLADVTC
jgi:hypothetical protein